MKTAALHEFNFYQKQEDTILVNNKTRYNLSYDNKLLLENSIIILVNDGSDQS
mgnify:CR=1 FL=1